MVTPPDASSMLYQSELSDACKERLWDMPITCSRLRLDDHCGCTSWHRVTRLESMNAGALRQGGSLA